RLWEAIDLSPEPSYDVVLSFGVFLYFPDAAYAAAVARRMVAKARRTVGILDVNDAAEKELALMLRRAANSRDDSLKQLFLDRSLFSDVAVTYAVTCPILHCSIPTPVYVW